LAGDHKALQGRLAQPPVHNDFGLGITSAVCDDTPNAELSGRLILLRKAVADDT
jgi:hypothetical protein